MNRIYYLDYARVFAIIAVIILHVSGFIIEVTPPQSNYPWAVANVFDSLTRWCVPLFVMISGALMLSQPQTDIITFFKKRASKVLIPFFVWSIFYLFFRIYILHEQLTTASTITDILVNGTYAHLWFFYMIIGLYLVTPILRTYVSHASKRNIEYFIILWFLSVNLLKAIEIITNITVSINISPVTGFVGYFILGYYLTTYKLHVTKPMILLLVLTCLFTIFGTQYLSLLKGDFVSYLYEYLSFNTIIISFILFVIVQNVFDSKEPSHFINLVSKTSFGIYLIHMIFIYWFGRLGLNGFTFNPVVGILLTSVAVFISSFISILLIQKIPLLKRIVP